MGPPEAVALRGLASLVRSGLTVRHALAAWPEEVPGSFRDAALGVRRRLALGCSVRSSLSSLPSGLADPIAPLVGLHLATGDDLAAALDGTAAVLEEEAAFEAAARGASAGARLSARLVAGLPLAFVPFSPAARGAFAEPPGLALLVCGVVLCVTGLRWIGRLVPGSPAPDPVVRVYEAIAALLRAGLPLNDALAAIASHPPPGLEAIFKLASARVRLGQPWATALRSGDPRLERGAVVIDRAARLGIPLAGALEEFASVLRREVRSAHTTKMKRAPVLMVVPLTCCILPAYGLLAIGPFLLGVTTT